MQYLLAVIYGMVFGIANIIPGVSGGTMLVVFGCYDKVCGALTLNLKEIKKNIVFLVFFGIGFVVGLLGFAMVITWLLNNLPVETYMFFMGLIAGSIPLIIRNATVKEMFRPICAVPFILALALVVGLAVLEGSGVSKQYRLSYSQTGSTYTVMIENNSGSEINDWYIRIENGGFNASIDTEDSGYDHSDTIELMHYETIKDPSVMIKGGVFDCIVPNGEIAHIPPDSAVTFTYSYGSAKFTPADFTLVVKTKLSFADTAMFLIAGFIAAVAMIIPGVSGSFIMMLLGTYETVIASIRLHSLNFGVIIPTAIGVIGGLILGARLITFLMKKFRLIVFSAILGLVVGSLYAIFPAGFGLNSDTLIGAAALIAGFAVAYIVGKHTKVEEAE